MNEGGKSIPVSVVRAWMVQWVFCFVLFCFTCLIPFFECNDSLIFSRYLNSKKFELRESTENKSSLSFLSDLSIVISTLSFYSLAITIRVSPPVDATLTITLFGDFVGEPNSGSRTLEPGCGSLTFVTTTPLGNLLSAEVKGSKNVQIASLEIDMAKSTVAFRGITIKKTRQKFAGWKEFNSSNIIKSKFRSPRLEPTEYLQKKRPREREIETVADQPIIEVEITFPFSFPFLSWVCFIGAVF